MGWFILSSIEWNGMKRKIMQNAQSTKIPHFKYKVVFLSQITRASFSYEISLLKIYIQNRSQSQCYAARINISFARLILNVNIVSGICTSFFLLTTGLCSDVPADCSNSVFAITRAR